MLKKITIGTLWTIWTYFIVILLVSGISGAVAGIKDPGNASAAGAAAGGAIVTKYGGIILGGTILFGVVGTASGFYPVPGADRIIKIKRNVSRQLKVDH